MESLIDDDDSSSEKATAKTTTFQIDPFNTTSGNNSRGLISGNSDSRRSINRSNNFRSSTSNFRVKFPCRSKLFPLLKADTTVIILLLLYCYLLLFCLSILKPVFIESHRWCFVLSINNFFCCIEYYNICRLYVLTVVENIGAR